MIHITLQRLTLDKFKGIEHLEMEFGGRGVSIYGDNASGKTTVYDAHGKIGARLHRRDGGLCPVTQDHDNLNSLSSADTTSRMTWVSTGSKSVTLSALSTNTGAAYP